MQRRLQRMQREARTGIVDSLFRRRTLAILLRREHVLCLGDSHVNVMRHVRLPGVWFRARPVLGATASGVLNPQTVTNARKILTARLERAGSWQQVILQLGEVDCGFVIWDRAQRRGLSVAEQLDDTLDAYATFIAGVVAMGFARVLVLSAPLPTIGDDPSLWGEVANLRKAVTATQRERTELTLAFNDGLRARCADLGATFVDVTTGHMDPETGLVRRDFQRESSHDHHLARDAYASQVASELAPLLRRSPGAQSAGRSR